MPVIEKNTKNQELDAQNRKLEMIRLRHEERRTLQYVADKFHISRQRVAQIIGNTGEIRKTTGDEILDQDLNLTNEEVAEKLGVSVSYVSALRSQRRHAIKSSDSGVSKGFRIESWLSEQLSILGIDNELMPYGHEYDILAAGVVRIDVKSAFVPRKYNKRQINPSWSFMVRKGKRDDCDFYACVIVPTSDVFIIPASEIPDNQHYVSFTWPSKANSIVGWERFYQAYDLITEYNKSNGGIISHIEPKVVKVKNVPVSRENVKNVTIRLPVSLYETIKEQATMSRRSINQHVIFMLERYYPPGEDKGVDTHYGGIINYDDPD